LSDQSEDRKRLLVVGSGNMARVHTSHWRRIPEVRLAGIASHDPDSARKLTLADQSDVMTYESLEAALGAAGDAFDIIDICTPTPSHEELAIEALAAGKHVLLEKPMARTVDACKRIVDAAEEASGVFMVAHVLRYFPEYALAKRQVDAGAVGVPAVVRTARLASHPTGAWKDWYADPAHSGGVILDMIIHDFDWLLWTFGPVDRVFAKGLVGQAEHQAKLDYALVTLHHASGTLSHVAGSTFEICGDAGMLEHDSDRIHALTLASRSASGASAGVAVPESPMSPRDDPYYKEIRHFTDCILSGAKPDITPHDALAAVQVAEAALTSIETGAPVSVAA
jgi:UDP-N-acetylglucosamine 3-dehydrogenase